MHNIRIWLLAACSVFTTACMLDAVNGSGKIVTEPRTVSGFSSVSLRGSGQLIVEQTGNESLTVTTDDNLLPYISTEVSGGRLELGTKHNITTNLRPSNDIIYKLTVKKLEGLDVSGSGRVDAKRIDQDRLQISVSGSGEISAQGAAADLDLGISGSGRYEGGQLKTRNATVAVSGSGDALVSVSDTLRASVSGSGSIDYVGDPQVTQNISGSGSVRRR